MYVHHHRSRSSLQGNGTGPSTHSQKRGGATGATCPRAIGLAGHPNPRNAPLATPAREATWSGCRAAGANPRGHEVLNTRTDPGTARVQQRGIHGPNPHGSQNNTTRNGRASEAQRARPAASAQRYASPSRSGRGAIEALSWGTLQRSRSSAVMHQTPELEVPGLNPQGGTG